ncbi:MAG TPA: SRPBCC family protein [Fimbriimonadales bacterium]|jgi:hypothetical protein|nr:SRPBCC family protein [Fimbriimonadales bacterium]
MFSFTEQVDVMAQPDEIFNIVGDLTARGHYYPDSVLFIREMAPRPPSETEKFLPGQTISFTNSGETRTSKIVSVEEWDKAEAVIVEQVASPTKAEVVTWRLSELLQGTIRVMVHFEAEFGMVEKMSKGPAARKFYSETLERLKKFCEDKLDFAGPRTYAPKPVPIDPLSP